MYSNTMSDEVKMNGFTRCNMEIFHDGKKVCDISAIKYNETREKTPIYTMGSGFVDPRKFRRATRAVAGSIYYKDGVDLEHIPMSVDEVRFTARNQDGEAHTMSLLDISFIDNMKETFIAKHGTPWKPTDSNICECGGDACNTTHSNWCPKFS